MKIRRCPRQPRKLGLTTGVAVLLALSSVSAAQAQQASISLQSQSVSAALQALARRTGAQILFTPDLTFAKRLRRGREVCGGVPPQRGQEPDRY